MKKYILPLILILLITFTLTGYCAWLAGWDYRIEFAIGDYAGDIGASVTWFPIDVFLTATQGEEVFVELTTDAEFPKVAFTKADGTTELYGECELFDVSEELGIYHVSRDGWVINANTSIYMYYDADHADNNTYIGAINTAAGAAVWDGNFDLVCHMVDDTVSTVKDSTSQNNDGIKIDDNDPIEVTGKVGQAQDFDGTEDYINFGVMAEYADGDFTLESIFEPDVDDVKEFIMHKYDFVDITNPFITFQKSDTNKLFFAIRDAPMNRADLLGTVNILAAGGYAYVVGVRDTASNVIRIYTNGGDMQSADESGVGSIDNGDPIVVGGNVKGAVFTDGVIDEFRISSSVRSAAWIKGTYNSLWDSLLTYGSEETEEAVTVNSILFGTNF